MRPGDRLICAFVEPTTVGDQFTDWPLHLTVVPWFRVSLESSRLVALLTSALASNHTFTVELGEAAYFGQQGKKLVHLVVMPNPIQQIEQQTRALLHRHDAWLVDETTQHHRVFRPHITNQLHVQAMTGEAFGVDELYIVEQRGGYKTVVGAIRLA